MEESADEGQVTPSAKRASLPTTPRSGLQSPAVGQDVGIEDSTPALRVRPCNLGTDDDDQDGRAPPHGAAGPRRPSGVGDDEDNGNAQFFDITEVLEIFIIAVFDGVLHCRMRTCSLSWMDPWTHRLMAQRVTVTAALPPMRYTHMFETTAHLTGFCRRTSSPVQGECTSI